MEKRVKYINNDDVRYVIVEFKSSDEFYIKEWKNTKNNTVRVGDGGERFRVLDKFKGGLLAYPLYIKIVEAGYPQNSFLRRVRDVSVYEGTYIITWDTIHDILRQEEKLQELSKVLGKCIMRLSDIFRR